MFAALGKLLQRSSSLVVGTVSSIRKRLTSSTSLWPAGLGSPATSSSNLPSMRYFAALKTWSMLNGLPLGCQGSTLERCSHMASLRAIVKVLKYS
ncbi:hypothetical protein M408DRAFT_129985 [Serendipita vermifera MAFF 305830]|uniref:Uncharacterized protein n=1 Tax=Serendipita vermifera MAFF 305830 TaxID=933852 RepID=A0A0C2WSR9_SERVB|nr:hypothetical protein M408DRAFT_129985 [Serendipita vermifera MAFF 305830]